MKTIELLKKRLSMDNTLITQLTQAENGDLSHVKFTWKLPKTDDEISQFEKSNSILLPEGYKQFLKVSNGATLFNDVKYGGGIRIYGLDEIIENTNFVRGPDNDTIKDSWLYFGRDLSFGDAFIFDLEKIKNNDKVYVLYGQSGSRYSDYEYLGSFETWLDRVIVAQGAQYWLWFPNC